MGELRSAWEIAQEKAEKLGILSPEEQRQQKEQQCCLTGTALAQKYLDAPEWQALITELQKYPEEEQDSIRGAIISHLAETMDLRNTGRLERAVEILASLESRSQPITEQITELIEEFHQAEKKTRQEIEHEGRETLHQMRISGTAVGSINIEAREEWRELWYNLVTPFAQRLDTLKQELSHL